MLTLAQIFRDLGHLVYIAVGFEVPGSVLEMPAEVPWDYFGVPGNLKWYHIKDIWLGAYRLRKLKKKFSPDVVIAFPDVGYISTLTTFLFARVPIVASERVAPRFAPISLPWRLLRLMVMWRANAVVVVASDIRKDLRNIKGQKIEVIPGPIRKIDHRPHERETPDGRRRFLCIGRLVDQKGFDLVIQAFASLSMACPEWDLWIVGIGPRQGDLEEAARQCGVLERTSFLPPVHRVEQYLSEADVFVLPSRFEGYPRVLAEAMMAGLPCIASDCPGGSTEMIQHSENGLIFSNESISELTDAMVLLAQNPDIRRKLAANAPGVYDQCSAEHAGAKWVGLIEEIVEAARFGDSIKPNAR